MKIATIVGARPQFIKTAPVSKELRRRHQEVLVHTGQHYDDELSGIFFRELDIPPPDYELGIGSGSHGRQTGLMLVALEEVLEKERPDWVMVYGDTNSTLAGALAASKLHLPIAHVEAGVRSYNRLMPEEVNRVLTDHLASLLFCPSFTAMSNLGREGIQEGVWHVGDVMRDAMLRFLPVACARSSILARLRLEPKSYGLLTLHRAENVDGPERLMKLLRAVSRIDIPVIFIVHPRTRNHLAELGSFAFSKQLRPVDPIGYLDMLVLQSNARIILTDSGGVQREAHFLSVPSIIIRKETEWPELLEAGASRLAEEDLDIVMHDLLQLPQPSVPCAAFGNGDASLKIVRHFDLLEGAAIQPNQFSAVWN
jgi:UDP-N-acetylglucosamine 2-epimerase